jgi:dTDP-glucose 4,6-dehydratase
MRILVTGGAGFIGSNFIRYLLGEHPEHTVINVDKLTYAGNLSNLADVQNNPQYSFQRVDICNQKKMAGVFAGGVDAVVNFAAESHVDRSIENSSYFVRTNVSGTQRLLELARQYKAKRFVQVGTDEVYGSIEGGVSSVEDSPLLPNSPYAASKAAADLFCRAYVRTYRFPVIVTRCTNNYGPFQHPEKFIPLMISNAMEDKFLPVYGDGLNVRDWIYVADHCSALGAVLHRGREGETYNIGGGSSRTNLDIVYEILLLLGKPASLVQFVKDRPGHDRVYALNCEKLQRELGWSPKVSFEEGLAATVRWYQENSEWVRAVRSGAYRAYYRKFYERRELTLARYS